MPWQFSSDGWRGTRLGFGSPHIVDHGIPYSPTKRIERSLPYAAAKLGQFRVDHIYRESLDILFDRHGLPDIFSDGRQGDGPAKKAIVDLVKTTTDKASPNFVPPEARIATFDQDGTTWVEHPIYT
jgi:hypothetical protein